MLRTPSSSSSSSTVLAEAGVGAAAGVKLTATAEAATARVMSTVAAVATAAGAEAGAMTECHVMHHVSSLLGLLRGPIVEIGGGDAPRSLCKLSHVCSWAA
jgi:hypothetical protein